MAVSPDRRKKSAKKRSRKLPESSKGQTQDHLIPGYHAVRETLERNDGPLQEIWVAQGKPSARAETIQKLAASRNIPVYFKNREYIFDILKDMSHQGIVGVMKSFDYWGFQKLLQRALEAGPSALLLAADHMADAGNLGALMRTAAFFGGHGLILPKDRCAGITPAVLKRSSGAHALLPVARVTNLNRALDQLSKSGLWIVGTAGNAPVSVYDFDWKRPLVLVLGGEQKGIGPSIRKRCHQLVAIPSPSGFESLNVSVAGGVILSEIYRQRG